MADHPSQPIVIPSREEILAQLETAGAPCSLERLAQALVVRGRDESLILRKRLRAMVRDGQLVETRDHRYGLPRAMEILAGRVIGHPDGFAFVRPDDGSSDIYLAPRDARSVLHGDRLLVRIAGQDARDRPYGMVVEVLERGNREVVGRYLRDDSVGYVNPDNRQLNQDILIPAGRDMGAQHGQIVVAAIELQPDRHHPPVGRVIEVLGEHMAPGMEIDIAIRSHQLPVAWPQGLERELKRVPDKVRKADFAGREDLRELPFVTIDGVDARDFDDAIHCQRGRNGYVLWVAIADVAHYVRVGTLLDAAARERGTSVYFPAQVVPMLPEQLSNGICSLNPAVERLAMVCELHYDRTGRRRKARFCNAVIRSRARLIYEEVAPWLETPDPAWPADAPQHQLSVAYALYQLLRSQREARGALDIDTVEPLFIFNDARKIARIEGRRRNDAHRLIEEFMIAANVAAAEHLIRHRRPAMFRVHAAPEGEKTDSLRQFLASVGLGLGGGDKPEARDYARVLAAAKTRPDRHLIETVVLRGLKLAVYSPDNVGHFGLGLESYAHFTSPIRRYPDLLIHRALKRQLLGEPPASEDLSLLGEHCSMTERRADDATRDAVAWLKCEYMLDKVGESFSGIVSAVTSFGLFVQLDDSFVEGLLHVTALPDDYYTFDPVGHCMVGRRSQREYRLGQRLRVVVARVSLDERKIDFAPADPSPASGHKRRGPPRKRA